MTMKDFFPKWGFINAKSKIKCCTKHWQQSYTWLSAYMLNENSSHLLTRRRNSLHRFSRELLLSAKLWLTTGNRMRFDTICSNEEVELQVGDMRHTQLSWTCHEFCTARNSLSCGCWRRHQEPGAELLGVLFLNMHCHQLQPTKTSKRRPGSHKLHWSHLSNADANKANANLGCMAVSAVHQTQVVI